MSPTFDSSALSYLISRSLFDETRRWGIRCDYVGLSHLFSIGVNATPAMRIVLFGCSIWFGRIPCRPKVVTKTWNDAKWEVITTTYTSA